MKKTVSMLLTLFLLLVTLAGCQQNNRPADGSESSAESAPIQTKEYQMPSHMYLRYKEFNETQVIKMDVQYNGRTMTVQREDKVMLTVEVDEQGRVVKEILYTANGRFDSHNEYVYGDDGQLQRKVVYYESGAVNYHVDYTYDENGKLLQSKSTNANNIYNSRIEYTYSPDGVLLQKLTHSGGSLTKKESFDESGKPTGTLYYDSNGEVSGRVEYVYDENGLPVEQTTYDGERVTSSLSYDENGTLISDVSYTSGGGLDTEILYDGHGNEIRHTVYNWYGIVREGASYSCAYTYDENGNMTEFIRYNAEDILQWSYTYEYDENGTLRKESVFDEDGTMTRQSEYDEHGVLVRSVDTGHTLDGEYVQYIYHYTYRYNDNGDPLEELQIEEDGTVECRKEWTYDENGNLIRYLSDRGSIVTNEEYTYDENGRKIEYEYRHERLFDRPWHLRTTYAYDTDGNLSRATEYREMNYGWITSEETVYSDYDENGNATVEQIKQYSAAIIDAHTENTYDKNGNLLSSLIYDPYGNLIQSETYQYDAEGREILQESYDAKENTTYRFESAYDENGVRTTRGYYNTQFYALEEYDENGNMTLVTYYNGAGETVSSIVEKTYDEAGRIVKEIRYEGDRKSIESSRECVYDENDRLVKEIIYTNYYSEEYKIKLYEFDEKGNMTLQTIYYMAEEPGDLEGARWTERRRYTYDGDGCLQTEDRDYNGGNLDYKYNVTESTAVALTEAQYEQLLARIGELLGALYD